MAGQYKYIIDFIYLVTPPSVENIAWWLAMEH